MKLSKRTVDVLRNFSTINPSILFRKGNVISTMAPSKKIIATAQVEETIQEEFGIYELSRLLGVLSLFKEPDVEFLEKKVRVSGDGRAVDFTYSPPESIISGPTTIEMPDVIGEFDLSTSNLATGLKTAGVLSAPILEFKASDGRVSLRTLDPKNPSSHTSTLDLGEADTDFVCLFKVETFKFLPMDYRVQISSKKIGKFVGDGITYFVASELAEQR